MKIGDYEFVCTCSACPEQYDVFDKDGNQVGYVRLRWGSLYAECPYVGGTEVYRSGVGDNWGGCFKDDKQRRIHLNRIAKRISLHNKGVHCPYCGEEHHLDVWHLDDLTRFGLGEIECGECEEGFVVRINSDGELFTEA